MRILGPLLALLGARGVVGEMRQYAVSIDADTISTGTPLDGFVSFAIEFSSFPDFAGNKSNPNTFSNDLLSNIGYLQGIKPYIRVGGNTQDYAIYKPKLPVGIQGTFNSSRSTLYPTTIEIGPSFFESYQTWPNVKFSHGFNMGGNNDARVWDTLYQTVPLACKALGNGSLYWWEYGNEADLYASNRQRPYDYDESDFVAEWLNGTRIVNSVISQVCLDMLCDGVYGYLAPSFAGTNNHLSASRVWSSKMNEDSDIKFFSSHNYIDSASSPGITLEGTLLNHTRTKYSIDALVSQYDSIKPGVPHILGETNSLSGGGKRDVSDTFGAALWTVDYLLYCASVDIKRVHLQLGTNFVYGAWQPLATSISSMGTKPPYYGAVAVAAFLGNLNVEPVQVAHLQLGGNDETESAYAVYMNNTLRRLMVINMNPYNYTTTHNGQANNNSTARRTRTYSFNVGIGAKATVQRLSGNGSDAVTAITWDGWSYESGQPVRLGNVTVGETVEIKNGVVEVAVQDSQAVVLNIDS